MVYSKASFELVFTSTSHSKGNCNIENVQYEIVRTSRNKWKIFKKTPTRIGKEALNETPKANFMGC
jgi:hypothetical protein